MRGRTRGYCPMCGCRVADIGKVRCRIAIRKPSTVAKGTDEPEFILDDPWMASTYPTLWEWLTSAKYEDGAPRQTLSLTVFAEEGRVKACLSDRDNERVAFVTGDTMEGMLAAAERALRDDTADWRASQKGWKGKGRK